VVTGVDSWGNVKALGFWYANRLTVAGDDALDVRGASFPGVPLVLAGTTGHATWSFAQQPARLAAASPAGDRVRFVVDGSDDAAAAAAVADATVRREVIRLREAPTAAAAAAAASSDAEQQQQEHRWLLDVLVGESPAAGIDVLPLLAPELQAACAQLNVSQVWLRSPLVTDADRVLVRLMRFVHRANRASSAQSLATAHDELALAETLPWRLFATDAHGAAVVVPAPSSLHSAAPVTTVVAGASPHIRRQLRAEAAAAAAAIDASVFDDVYSPSGALLAQQLLQLLRQHPLVLRAQRRRGGNDNATATATDGDGDAGEASLLRNEVLHQADLLAIIALLEAFDGRYTPEAVVPSIVEAFRMFFLVETTREPLGPLATMFYGAYNVSAVLRATELEMRDAVSRLLAPYVTPLCPAATAASGDDTCPGPRVSWWVEKAGGLPEVLQRSLDGALEWLYKINEARAIATWQWQNHHHLLVHHPVSPVTCLSLRLVCLAVCLTVCLTVCLVVCVSSRVCGAVGGDAVGQCLGRGARARRWQLRQRPAVGLQRRRAPVQRQHVARRRHDRLRLPLRRAAAVVDVVAVRVAGHRRRHRPRDARFHPRRLRAPCDGAAHVSRRNRVASVHGGVHGGASRRNGGRPLRPVTLTHTQRSLSLSRARS
jgi:hypothetical protein